VHKRLQEAGVGEIPCAFEFDSATGNLRFDPGHHPGDQVGARQMTRPARESPDAPIPQFDRDRIDAFPLRLDGKRDLRDRVSVVLKDHPPDEIMGELADRQAGCTARIWRIIGATRGRRAPLPFDQARTADAKAPFHDALKVWPISRNRDEITDSSGNIITELGCQFAAVIQDLVGRMLAWPIFRFERDSVAGRKRHLVGHGPTRAMAPVRYIGSSNVTYTPTIIRL